MHTLPELPYAYDALEPYLDAETMLIHHTKHHQAYVDKLNAALEKYPDLQTKSLEELLTNLDAVPEAIRVAVRNHGGGHWNHSFFWKILDQGSTLGDKGRTLKFATVLTEEIKKQFKDSALACFGSGWTWLVKKTDGLLAVMNTPNQDTPISVGLIPILALDLWEHAYYLKYQNRRADYIDAFLEYLTNGK